MAKGAIAKAQIIKEILGHFPGSFTYNDGKEIRIPGIEDGQELQVKVALTCAKTNVSPNGENALPGEDTISELPVSNTSQVSAEVTQEEKEELKSYFDNW